MSDASNKIFLWPPREYLLPAWMRCPGQGCLALLKPLEGDGMDPEAGLRRRSPVSDAEDRGGPAVCHQAAGPGPTNNGSPLARG